MRFPNAQKGVSRIYTAEILMLITSVLAIVAGIIMIGAASVQGADADSGVMAIAGGSLVVVLISGIVMIVAFILNLMGITSAMKDEPSFRMAMIFTLVGIGASVLSSALTSQQTVSNIFSWVSNLAKIIVTLTIIQGICNLAVRFRDSDMIDRGKRLMYILLSVQVLAFIASVIADIFQTSGGLATAGVIAIISAVIDIVAYFMYLGYLSRAKKMLNQ